MPKKRGRMSTITEINNSLDTLMINRSEVSGFKLLLDLGARCMECYNSYVKGQIHKPKLAIEIRHVDLRTRVYDAITTTVSRVWSATKVSLAVAAGSGVAGLVGALGIVGIDQKLCHIPSHFAYEILKDAAHFIGLPIAATGGRSLLSLGKIALNLGILAGLYRGAEQIYDAFHNRRVPVSQPIFPPKLNSEIMDLIAVTYNQKQHSGFFQNVLLYGPGGTGKTMLSRWIAENSKMNYIMMSGGDLSQYIPAGRHVSELNTLFEGVKKAPSPTILFIDEAESLCKKRSNLSRTESIELLNALLNHTGEPSKKVMIILATNRLEDIDPAVLNRMDYKIRIDLPEIAERKKILDSYLPQFFSSQERQEVLTDSLVFTLAERTEGVSGRVLFKLLNQLASLKTVVGTQTLTSEMILTSADRFIERERRAMADADLR